MSLQGKNRLWIKAAVLLAAAAFVFALPAAGQYPGQVAKPDANAPDMRAVGVYEWTGDEAHPKAGRMVPVCIYDGQDLNDAGVYLAQPEPLALQTEVEYQLQRDGQPVGLFDVNSAGELQGAWFGFGKWKPSAEVKICPGASGQGGRKRRCAKRRAHFASQTSRRRSCRRSGFRLWFRIELRVRVGLERAGSRSRSSDAAQGRRLVDFGLRHRQRRRFRHERERRFQRACARFRPAGTSRRRRQRIVASGSGGSTSSDDSSRPKLKKNQQDDEAYVSDVASAGDPDRPHLIPGKFAGYGAPVVPTLVGLPIDMQQTVAVSDAVDRPEHVWNYTWANPDDEDKMKAGMEDLARSALGLDAAPATPAKPATRTTAAHKSARPVPPPAPLLVEQFRVFQLAYDGGATLVLSAHTAGTGVQEKFVTLIAQPDLYGGIVVLAKNVTDAASLDLTPRMRLIDAVDAEADNRGELLFELRGTTQRQFALYRILRGEARRIFLSAPQGIATASAN